MGKYDYRCPKCGNEEERSHYLWEGVHPIECCTECDTPMDRLPSAPNFTIKGFNAKNGYSK